MIYRAIIPCFNFFFYLPVVSFREVVSTILRFLYIGRLATVLAVLMLQFCVTCFRISIVIIKHCDRPLLHNYC